jgi:1,4-alpha-glucan branching enzyme
MSTTKQGLAPREIPALQDPQPRVTAISSGNQTVFTCHSDTAKAIFLAGSFNKWSPNETPLTRNIKGGDWAVSLPLAPGRYQYKFLVDGEWSCEPGCTYKNDPCPHCIVNEFGTMNRVLEVQ